MFRQVGHNLGHQVVKSFLRKHNLDAWLSQWPCDRCRSLPSKSLGVGWCWMTINLVFRYSIVDHYQSWLGWSQFMLWVCRRIGDPGLIIIVAYDIIFDNFCDPYWNGHAAGISQFQTHRDIQGPDLSRSSGRGGLHLLFNAIWEWSEMCCINIIE